MWFPKWFGRRDRIEYTDEPARFAPPEVLRPAKNVSRPDSARDQSVPVANNAKSHPKKGFDPYNSGAFERRNAWERVGRR